MDRCPNCGAPAKPGAKFCTTCGYRLPAASASTNPVAETPRPESSWPDAPVIADSTTTTSTTTAAPLAQPTPAPASTWPTASTSSWETPVPTVTTTTTTTGAPVPSFTAPTAADATYAPYEDTGRGDRLADAGDDDAAVSGDADVAILLAEETVTVPEPASQFEAWSTVVEEVVAEPAVSDHGTPIARATALLDELRLLLPRLASGTGAGRHPGQDAIRQALDAESSDAASRDALRRVLEEARDNPRDIQAVLAIASQTEAVVALLDDHDRLINAARLALSPATEEAPGLYK